MVGKYIRDDAANANNHDQETDCKECSAGTYGDKRGLDLCKDCERGKYNAKSNQINCSICMKNQYQDQENEQTCKYETRVKNSGKHPDHRGLQVGKGARGPGCPCLCLRRRHHQRLSPWLIQNKPCMLPHTPTRTCGTGIVPMSWGNNSQDRHCTSLPREITKVLASPPCHRLCGLHRCCALV